MSESGRSSPRATDPKILTFLAPCRWAARRMRSRFSRSFAILGVRTSRRRGEDICDAVGKTISQLA